ncbi:hypothetical protein [Alteromonas hispanica]|uniref:Uncharacterized protein n=1 Tax=Alteromonas hispanica TaxID=315421 RepID=A0A6L9MQ27_9ALTE|nr:hypothetical protein [Alteromonas hispanica]NDW20005.1 hypothetical protein [Alteromonas hispanica]
MSTLDSENGVSMQLKVHKPRGAGDKTTLRELVSFYIDDSVADEIVIEKKLIPTFILFLSESSRTLQLLKDYLANGGSKYLAHDLGIEITKICLLLKDCNDERLSGWAEKMTGQFHTFTRDYFESIEYNE